MGRTMMGPLASPKRARRLAVLAGAVALAGFLRLGPSVLVVFLVAVAYVAALAILHLAPAQRRLVEAAAVGLAAPALLPVHDGLYLALALLCGGAAHHLVYGPPGRRGSLRFTATATRITRAGLPVEAVWAKLVPGSSHPDDYWSGTLVDYAADSDDPMTLYARFASDGGLFTEATFSFLEADPPCEARYQVEFDTLPEDEELVLHLRLTGEDRFSTLIESEAVRANLTLARAILLWFDDTMGDDWTGVVGPGGRHRTWQVDRLAAAAPAPDALPAVEEQAASAPAACLAPVAARNPSQRPPPAPKILNARLKDLPDPDDFEEPFDIMQLMEEARA